MNKKACCNSLSHPTQPLHARLRWLLLLAALAWAPMLHAQIIGAQDVFNYTTSNISGHAPTTGTGTWQTWYGTNCNISTNGSAALFTAPDQADAWLPFAVKANTIYTLTTTLQFTGTHSNWFGVGFNFNQNNAPWLLICPQSQAGQNSSACFCAGTVWSNWLTIPASFYTAPIVVTVKWNTQTGVAQGFVNSVLEFTGTVASPGGQGNAFMQAFCTGTAVNVLNTTLSAQAISVSTIAMQDNFTYTSSNLNGHAPTTVMGSGWSTNWVANYFGGTGNNISTTGSQAVLVTNGGAHTGGGQSIASFAFNASPNMFYSLRAALNFTGPIGAGYDCWVGLGLSKTTSGGNTGPWMFIRPQGLSTDNPQTAFNDNNSWIGSGWNVPASYYSAPITTTITWNTTTGETKFYINDLLRCTGTSTTLPNGQFYAFFQGLQTGNAVNVNTIALTAQPLPLPEVWYAPQYDGRPGYNDFPNNFNAIIDSGTCTWSTARSHTNVFNLYDAAFYHDLSAAQQKTLIQYLIKNNIQLGICLNALTKVPGTCADGEGYDNPANHQTAVANLRTAISAATNGSNNWSPAYISLDSPGYGFESGTAPCMSISVCAAQTAGSIGTFKAAWPNMKVVEYDSLSAFPQADVLSWFAAMRTAGQPIDGIADDFNWYTDWTGRLPSLVATCATSGVAYGLIYDGFCSVPGGDGQTDPNLAAQYALGMTINMQVLNASQSPLPPRAVVATWGTPQTVTCPETTTTNLSALCNLALTSPYVLQAPPVALYTVWGSGVWTRYTTSYSQYQAWISGTGGYSTGSVLGGVAQNPNAGNGILGLVPIYGYCNTSMSPNQYAISLSAADSDLNSYGYTMQSTLGYVFPTSNGAAVGGVPVYGCHKYVGPVNQYIYQNAPFAGLDDTFNPANDYRKRLNGGNPIGYMLPGFFHNGYSNWGPF